MKKLFLLLLLIPNLVFANDKSSNKNLRLALIQEWSTFNPITSQLASNEALAQFLVRRMTLRKFNGDVIPDLAESVPAVKNKMAVWKIKKSARWADGHEVSCEDWHLGWQAGLSPQVSVETRTVYSKIKNITWETSTPKTCTVTYTTDDWSYDRDLPPPIPAHIEKSVFNKTSKDVQGYDRLSNYVIYPNLAGLYNGPYAVSEFKLGTHVILTPNKYFYGTAPAYEKIIIQLISDTSSLKAHLQSGQIDGASAVGLPPDIAFQLEDEFNKNKSPYRVHFQNSAIFQGVFFNLDHPLLKDKTIREALYRSIDKQALVTAFYQNKLIPAEGILPPQHPSFQKKESLHSKKIARDLLEKSGWVLNKNNVREKQGQPLNFIFKTSAGIKVLESIQVYLCDQFKEIGVQCQIKNEPPRTLLGSSVPHGEFDMTMFGQPVPPDTSLTSYFSSTEIPSAANSWAGGNAMRLKSSEVDLLLKEFDTEKNAAKRNKLVQKIEKILRDEYFFIPLYHRREAVILPTTLIGLQDSFDGTSFFQPESWKIKN